MTRSARPARIAACCAGLALVLAGCGGSEGGSGAGDAGGRWADGAAAVVEGRTITVAELQEATRQVNDTLEAQGAQQRFTPAQVLDSLVAEPALSRYAAEHDQEVPSDGAAAQALRTEGAPSEGALDFVRASVIFSRLDAEQQAEVLEQVRAGDPRISPRYASAESLLPAAPPNWLEPSPAATTG